MILAFIPGDPTPQGRPRFVRRGRFVGAVDPERSRNWKKHARNCIRDTMAANGSTALQGPLHLSVLFAFACPASHCPKPTKRNPSPEPLPRRWRASRPDLDNLVKAVMDAANGLVFDDDSQVVTIEARKVWAAQGEPAGVHVTVQTVHGEP